MDRMSTPLWHDTPDLSRGHFKRFTKRALLLVMVAVAVAYCNETTDGPFAPAFSSGRSPPPITISPDSVFFSTIPDTAQLRASVMAVREDVKPDVAWTSSDEAVATVDSTGLVISAGKGEARITASFGGKSAEVPVVVDQLPATVEIVGSSPIFFLALHEYKEARAVIRDVAGNLTNDTVTWRSSDPEIVRVPSRCGGTPDLEFPCARSLSEGSASLIATLADSSMADTISVRVAIAARIRLLTPRSYTFLYTDTTFQIQAEALDAAQSVIEDAPISYTSQDTTVVTVDGDGNVEVVGYGSTWIALHAGNVSMQVLVDVHFPVSAIRVDPSEVKLYAEGDSVYLSAIAIAANHNERPLWGRDVAWATTDASIATVDDDGLLTAGAEGGASVIASYAEGNRVFRDTASVEVAYVGRISISPERLLLGIGQSAALTVTAYSSSGNVVHDIRASWSSSDTTLLTVNDQGLVTGNAIGIARVTAQVGELKASVEVEVGLARYQIRPSSVTFERPLKEQHLVAEFGITPIVDDSVEWSVADTTVAIIDDLGNLTSRRKGTTTVSASINGEIASASVTAFDPERDMLMALYHATDGPNWNRNGNWGTDQLIYESPGWEGIIPWVTEELVSQLPPSSPGNRFYASLDTESYMRDLIDGYTDDVEESALLLPALFQSMMPDDPFEEIARKNVGRVYAIELARNNMSGEIPGEFFETLSATFAVDMAENKLEGALAGLNVLDNLFVLLMGSNRLSGSLPPVINRRLFLFAVNGNELTGTPIIDAPLMTTIALSQNEFTGEFDITQNVSLQNANWSNTASLCTKPGEAFDEWRGADFRQNSIISGPLCDENGEPEVGGAFAVQVQLSTQSHFTAADKIDAYFQIVDDNGARVVSDTPVVWSLDPDSTKAAIGRDSVVRILDSDPTDNKVELQGVWTGSAHVRVQVKGSVLLSVTTLLDGRTGILDTLAIDSLPVVTYVPVTVDQEVVGIEVLANPPKTNTFGQWAYEGKDRTGSPAYVLPPVAVHSSDTTVVKAYRNGLLRGNNAGTATLTVSLQNGVTNSTSVTVNTNSSISSNVPTIDSVKVLVPVSGAADTLLTVKNVISPGDSIFLFGSNMSKILYGTSDGHLQPITPRSPCWWYDAVGSFLTAAPACPPGPPPELTYEAACESIKALWDAEHAAGLHGYGSFSTYYTCAPLDRVTFRMPSGPMFECTPDRQIIISAQTATSEGGLISVALDVDGVEIGDLDVGEVFKVDIDPEESSVRCLELPAADEERDYLITVHAAYDADRVEQDQDVVLSESDLSDDFQVGVRVAADDGLAGSSAQPVTEESVAAFQELQTLIGSHREVEAELRRLERLQRSTPGLAASRMQRADLITATTVAGDEVELYHTFGSGFCGSENLRTGVVKVANSSVVMVSDRTNANDYTDEEYAYFARILDEEILPELKRYFGVFSDLNDDGRVTVFFTDEVAKALPGLLGWVTVLDVVTQQHCAASNAMEIFYGRTPDDGIPRDRLLGIVPSLIAHELTHVMQTRPVVDETNPKTVEEAIELLHDIWVAEGQAMLAEEIVGFKLQGDEAGQNYGPETLENQRSGSDYIGEWYTDIFRDLVVYMHERVSFLDAISGTGPCSWWAPDPSPCVGRSLWYGVAWSFLRYVNDQHFQTYTAESTFHRDLIDVRYYAGHFETKTGEQWEDLLSQWNAMLYLDDNPEYPGLSKYQMTSWKLKEIMESIASLAESEIGPTPMEIPVATLTLPGRNIRLSSGVRYLVDTSGTHEEKSLLFDIGSASSRLKYPIRVIRIK